MSNIKRGLRLKRFELFKNAEMRFIAIYGQGQKGEEGYLACGTQSLFNISCQILTKGGVLN